MACDHNFRYVTGLDLRFFKFQQTSETLKLEKCKKQPPEVFCEKDVLSNFTKFTGEHLCQSLHFNKVAGLRPATLLKKRLWHRCFPVNFVKFLRTPFLTEHPWWLLLKCYQLWKPLFLKNTHVDGLIA